MSKPPTSLFVGHGAPTLALSQHPAADFLNRLGTQLSKPAAVIMVSPHWQTAALEIRTAPRLQAVHDFGGFDAALYQLRYEPPGAPQLVAPVMAALHNAGFTTRENSSPGIDHGVWVPLMRMFPTADVPVLQLSLPDCSAADCLRLGTSLHTVAAEQGALVIGSGSLVHNLRQIIWQEDAEPESWALAFEQWLDASLLSGDHARLAGYRAQAPHAAQAQPTDEHLMPLLVAVGAAGEGAVVQRLYDGWTYGNLSMAAYAFSAIGEG